MTSEAFRGARRAVRTAGALVSSLAGARALAGSGVGTDALARRLQRIAAARARYLAGVLEGMAYRLSGGHPATDVPDAVLTQRVRSVLGPLEKRIDVPHIRVTAENGIITVSGHVATVRDATELVTATSAIAGVVGVTSRIEVGFAPGDTRPSQGRHTEPSKGYRRLCDALAGSLPAAAASFPAADVTPRRALRAILSTFAARLPASERAHLLGHLPADVRALATPRAAQIAKAPHVRTADDLIAEISRAGVPGDPLVVERAVASVMQTLADLVPEEVADIAAVLPVDLRAFWAGALTAWPFRTDAEART